MATTIVDRLGNRESRRYDDAGRLLEVIDRAGGHSRYEYANGFLTGVIDSSGQRVDLEVDANGNTTADTSVIVSGTDSFTQTYQYRYDANDELVAIVNARGAEARQTLNAAGQATEIRDAVGKITSASYDADGRLISMTENGESQVAVIRDANGRAKSSVFSDGTEVVNQYDKAGRTVTQTIGSQTSSVEYDAAGRIVAQIDAVGNRTEIRRDALGNVVRTAHADGTVLTYEYDAVGRVTQQTVGGLQNR
ncbi:MAG: RHS repeat protein, partial [Planctomycetota bacterium]